MKYETPPEKIFVQVTSIILRARARAKATEALGKDFKNVAVEDTQYTYFERKEVKKHENQSSISY